MKTLKQIQKDVSAGANSPQPLGVVDWYDIGYRQGRKEENEAWLSERRCHFCGKEIKADGFSNTCAKCWEEQ